MIRRFLQSALCIALSPLLSAQQNDAVRIPKDTNIKLVALESISSESASSGESVNFAVARDVVVNGVIVLRAGTPLTGIVIKAVRGIAGKRDGLLKIRVTGASLDGKSPFRLTRSDPRYRQKPGDRFKEGAANTLEVLGGVALLPIELPMAIAMSAGGNGKPSGENAVLPRCFQVDYWTGAPATLEASDLAKTADQAAALDQDKCVTGQEKPVIDWSVSDLYHLTVE